MKKRLVDAEICKGIKCFDCPFNKGKDGCLLAKRLDEIEITAEPCAVPSAQPEEHMEKRTETHASDCISRQALCEYALNQKDKNITANDIMRFPSAQPKSYREGYQAGYKDAQSEIAERTAETAQNVSDEDLISRKAAIDAVEESRRLNHHTDRKAACDHENEHRHFLNILNGLPPADRWILCSEKLPEINQTVLLSTTDGEVIVGYRYKPDIVWQVTANDGRKIWVYDPENYPGNIDELPKAETCGFENRDNCWLSVTSINYDLKFAGISAWMPLPEPYKEDEQG